MKRIIALVLALVASTAVGAVNIPVRNPSGGTTQFTSGMYGNKPLVWTATGWNPADVTSTLNSYWASGSTSNTVSWATVSGPTTGNLTVTFSQTGVYAAQTCLQHRHAQSYTNMVMYAISSTSGAALWSSDGIAGFRVGTLANSSDGSGCKVEFVNVTAANQTYVMQVNGQITSAGTTAGHTFFGGLTVWPL